MKILVKAKFKGANAAFTGLAIEPCKVKPMIEGFEAIQNLKEKGLDLSNAVEKVKDLYRTETKLSTLDAQVLNL